MNQSSEVKKDRRGFPAIVSKVVDSYKVVINRGVRDGVRKGQRFLLYWVTSEEIIDPETGKPLGFLEVPKGTGEIIHVQDSIAILESVARAEGERKIIRRTGVFLMHPPEEEIYVPGHQLPFNDPKVGDKAKPI